MRHSQTIFAAISLFCIGAASENAKSQTTVPSAPSLTYDFGTQVAVPQLIPFAGNPPSPNTSKKKLDGNFVLSLEIDQTGTPQRIMLLKPHSDGLDRLAIQVAEADRFKPGAVNGNPVTVKASLELRFQGCLETSTDPASAGQEVLLMRAWPQQTLAKPAEPKLPPTFSKGAMVNKGVSAPVPLNDVMPSHSQKSNFHGNVLVSVVVDEYGLPQNPRVVRGSGETDVDDNAIASAMSYRFKPAMKDNQPVPVMISISVNFT